MPVGGFSKRFILGILNIIDINKSKRNGLNGQGKKY